MGKNQKNQKPDSASRFNIFKSVNGNCPIQTIRRRIVQRYQSPQPATHHGESPRPAEPRPIKIDTTPVKPEPLTQSPSNLSVPIKFDYSHPKAAHFDDTQLKDAAKPKPVPRGQRVKPAPFTHKFSGETHTDDHFQEFINRTGPKIRATSSLGGADREQQRSSSGPAGKAFARKETSKDVFSDYIRRAKMKIRATSSMGEGK